jgi:error-prone DNA polymerase
MTAYAELAVTTNFSFLRGASHPYEMVEMADALGLAAIGVADRNSFAGVVRAYGARKTLAKAKEEKAQKEGKTAGPTVKLIVGTRLVTIDGFEVIAYPTEREAYGRLCRLLTEGNLRGKKAECLLTFEEVLAAHDGQMLIALPPDEWDDVFVQRLAALARAAPERVFLAGVHRHRGDEPRRLRRRDEFGERAQAPRVAGNDVL